MFFVFLWILVWGGMFSGPYNLEMPGFTSSAFNIFQGLRALFPLLALYLSMIWIIAKKPGMYILRTPLVFFLAYGLTGVCTSLLLSVNPVESLYWVGVFLSSLSVVWCAIESERPREALRSIIVINYAVFVFIAVSLIPEAVRVFLGRESFSAYYKLFFGLGEITKNGAGRFGLVMLILCFVRYMTTSGRRRYLWFLGVGPAAFLVMMTQSRTALLGFAVVAVLFVLLWGADWRYLFLAPAGAFVLWTSGIKWRSQGSIDRLLSLTGRETTWQKGWAQIEHSPFLGWGFNADRLLLRYEHMHNAILQALIQTGIIGCLFFCLVFIWFWWELIASGLIQKTKTLIGSEKAFVMESILIVAFMTARSFFESTAAFYGVDLLLLVPSMAYAILTVREKAVGINESAEECAI